MSELPEHVHVVRTPTGIPVGPVNCYILDGSPLTLVDTGIKSERSLAVLGNGLAELGRQLEDCERILITHGHVDHIGLVASIFRACQKAGRSEPEVYIHEADARRVTDYDQFIKERADAYVRIADECGASQEGPGSMPVSALLHYFKKLGESIPRVHSISGDMSIETGIGPVRAIHVPGHSLGSVCYVSDEHHVVFSGDHILSNISSNPSLDSDTTTDITMSIYLKSLSRMRDFSDYIALPGHRDFIRDIPARVRALEEEYRQKLEKTASLLGPNARSIFQLSHEIYGNYSFDQTVLALSETLDLVRILQSQGKAALVKRENAWHAVSA